MASLRASHSWQPGYQLESRDSATADPSSARAGPSQLYRRHIFTRISAQRRGRRARTCLRHYGNVTRAIKIPEAYGGSPGMAGQAETVGVLDSHLSQACKLLRVGGAEELQDLIASLILSECVYKKLELDEGGVAAKVTEFAASFPPGWVQLQAVQLSLAGIPQHYLIATSPSAMYVAFMGTKQFQDILADANLLHTPVWAESARLAADRQSIPAAHRGFLERARVIHVEQLYELAVSRGLRLVLCGHSLGGAVAKLCTLRLLRELPDWPRPRVRCVAFATPAVGNAALAELVETAGWASHFSTYYLPEDQLVRLISFSQARASSNSLSGSGSGGDNRSTGAGGVESWGRGSNGKVGGRVFNARAERRRRAKEGAGDGVGKSAPSVDRSRKREREEQVSSGTSTPAAMELAAGLLPAASATAKSSRLDKAVLDRLPEIAESTPSATSGAPAVLLLRSQSQSQSPVQAQTRTSLIRSPSASSITSSASSCALDDTMSSVSSFASSLRRSSSFEEVQSPGVDNLEVQRTPEDPHQKSDGSATEDDTRSGSAPLSYKPLHAPTVLQARIETEQTKGKRVSYSMAVFPPVPVLEHAVGSILTGGRVISAGGESSEDDHAGVVMAMEEILAPGPDELEAAAAAGVALSGQPPTDLAAAQREALYGNAGGSWGLRLALSRKRVMRRLRRLAARARIPLPKALLPVPRYHTFGEQWFVTEEGALSPEELERMTKSPQRVSTQEEQQQQPCSSLSPPPSPPPQQQQQPQAGAPATSGSSPSGPSDGARGFFSFHRMVAYRQRYTDLMWRLMWVAHLDASPDRRKEDMQGMQPQPPKHQQQQQQANQASADIVMSPHGAVQLSDNLLPRISIQRAVLRGLLLPEAPAAATTAAATSAAATAMAGRREAKGTDGIAAADPHQAPGGNPHAAVSHPAAGGIEARTTGETGTIKYRYRAAVAPVVGHVLRWIRGRGAGGVGLYRAGSGADGFPGSPDGPVRLDLELEGHNLQYCRKVSVTLVRTGAEAGAVAATAGTATGLYGELPAAAVTAVEGGDGKAVAATGGWGVARWPPLAATWGGGSRDITADKVNDAGTAAGLGSIAGQDRQQAVDAGTTAPPLPLPVSSMDVPTVPPPPVRPQGSNFTRSSSSAAAASSSASSTTEVPCEVVQVLYAQPYTDEANPPPLHPVSLFRNTLHHFARNLMRRCRLPEPAQGSPVTGGLARLGAGMIGDSCSSSLPRKLTASDRFHFVGPDAARSIGSSGFGATVNPNAVKSRQTTDAMPSRLLLRVTVQRSVARGLLDGTLPAQLMLSARSDFHALSNVPVVVHRPRVAILGTSPYAASLVQALLSAPAALSAANLQERAAAAAGESAGLPAVGLAAWMLPPMAWALAAVRGSARGPRATPNSVTNVGLKAAVAVGPTPSPAATQPTASAVAGFSAALPNTRQQQQQGHSAHWLPLGRTSSSGMGDPGPTATTLESQAADAQPRGGSGAHMWWTKLAPQAPTGKQRVRLRLGKLRWGIRQSLAAAAVGAAAAAAAGVTGAAAAVGAAAVVASAVVAFSSTDGASVFVSAAVTVAAVVAAAAAAATAFAGSETAVLVAAAASAAAVAMAAATSSGAGVSTPPPPPPQQQEQEQQGALIGRTTLPSSSSSENAPSPWLQSISPKSMPAPRLGSPRTPRTTPSTEQAVATSVDAPAAPSASESFASGGMLAAAGSRAAAASPQSPAWVLRFGARPTTAQPGARSAQARGGSGGGGGVSNKAAAEPGTTVSSAAAGGTIRPVGRGWVLWWPGRAASSVSWSSSDKNAVPATEERTAAAPSPLSPRPPQVTPPARWLPWHLSRIPDGGIRPTGPAPVSATAAFASVASAAASSLRQGPPAVLSLPSPALPTEGTATITSTAATATILPVQNLSSSISKESRRRPAGWFPQLGRTAAADASSTTAGGAARHPVMGGGNGGGGARLSLVQLRAQLLGSLRAGSGRAALPLPPGILSDGLELYNIMVEPVSRTWSSARADATGAVAATTAAGERHVPFQPPPRDTTAAGVVLAPVSAARLWKGRCPGPSACVESLPPTAGNPTPDAASDGSVAATLTAAPGRTGPMLADPRRAAEAARIALDNAAAAAGAALGIMPAHDGCPELVGVAPFVAVRRMEEGLRRQVLQRGMGWRALLGGVVDVLLRPVVLVGMLGRLPAWGLLALRRGHAIAQVGTSASGYQAGDAGGGLRAETPAVASSLAATPSGSLRHSRAATSSSSSSSSSNNKESGGLQRSANDWGAVVVTASCRDPMRVLRGRDMEALRNRAADAACPLVPVLLTCMKSPPGRRAAALRMMAAACGVSPEEVRVVWLDAGLLHQPAAAIPRADLAAVWQGTAACEGAVEVREAVRQAVAAAAVQVERHEVQQIYQQLH